MKAKISVFLICVEAIIYLLLYNLHDCTFKCAEATCVWKLLLRQKKMLQTERHTQCQCSLKVLVHINMFQQYYLGNSKPAFLASNLEQVYAAILESSKNSDLFQNRQTCSARFPEISQNFFDMVSVRPACYVREKGPQ